MNPVKNSQFASSSLTAGQLNAIVKKLGGRDGALRFLRGETLVVKPDCIGKRVGHGNTCHFSVTSDGTTGQGWIDRFEKKGLRLSEGTKEILLSSHFKPTDLVTSEIVVLTGDCFEFQDRDTIETSRIYAKVENRLTEPTIEIACLIRDLLTSENIWEMAGFWWIAIMHKPVQISSGRNHRLVVERNYEAEGIDFSTQDNESWPYFGGFAFVAAQY